MLAAVVRGKHQVELTQVPSPKIVALDDVLVQIKACGFCQTDYKAITAARTNVTYPCILGHEGSGVVVEVGDAVQWLKPGDAVIIQPSGYCGRCSLCRTGLTHFCRESFVTGGDGPPDVRPGFFAEYAVVKEHTLFKKPQSLSFEQACLTEPLSGAWKGLVQYSQIGPGDDVVIIGVGGIGLLGLMVAKIAGAGKLVAIDPSSYALNNARATGATHTLTPDQSAQLSQIMPDGPDVVIEAAGNVAAVNLALELRRRGTRWNLFGITTDEQVCINAGREHFLESRWDASFGTNPLAMTKAIRLMERGLVDTARIISHRYHLRDFAQAVATMGIADRNKVVVFPDPSLLK